MPKLTRRSVMVGGLALSCGPAPFSYRNRIPDLIEFPHLNNEVVGDTHTEDNMPQNADPVVLYANAVLATNGSAAPDASALVNPHGLPMELLEVRFRVVPLTATADDYVSVTGNAVGVKMDMGQIPIVDADVPLNMFGTVRDTYEGSYLHLNENDIPVLPTSYGWRLANPLFIPPGACVLPTFSHLGQNANPVRVDVAYICRVVENLRPDIVRVPWVGTYNAKGFDILGRVDGLATAQPAQNDKASNLDIFNPFKVPLFLNRMTGRCAFLKNQIAGEAYNQFVVEDLAAFHQRYASIRMRSSRGDDIIRNKLPIDLAFPASWRAWEFPGEWQMRPGEFYSVRVDVDEISDIYALSDYVGRVQMSVGLIGYREIPRKVMGV